MHKRSLNELVSLCFNQCNASSNFGSSKHSSFQKKQTQETFEQDRQHHVAFLSGRFFPGLPLLWFWVHFLIVLHSLLQRLCHHSHDFSCLSGQFHQTFFQSNDFHALGGARRWLVHSAGTTARWSTFKGWNDIDLDEWFFSVQRQMALARSFNKPEIQLHLANSAN